MKRRQANRGSVILLVVGLLTIITLMGGSFLLVSNLDQRQSRAVATGAPMDSVAEGVLGLLVEDRAADLHLSANRPYAGATLLSQLIDYPDANVDPALSTIDGDPTGTPGEYTWNYVTNIGDAATAATDAGISFAGPSSNVLTDTDEDGIGDAILWPTGTTNANGEEYYVAVRMIDTSGLLNVNTAGSIVDTVGTQIQLARAGYPMPPSDITLQGLLEALGAPMAAAFTQQVHEGGPLASGRRGFTTPAMPIADPDEAAGDWNQNYSYQVDDPELPTPGAAGEFYLPFDAADFTALSTRENPRFPSNRSRLYLLLGGHAGGPYDLCKRYLTTYSASRVYIPQPNTIGLGVNQPLAQTYKADLNWKWDSSAPADVAARYEMLFRAFYNAVPAGLPELTDGADDTEMDRQRRLVAAQMAVNVIDYTDINNDPTPADSDPITGGPLVDPDTGSDVVVYGVERQPVLTKAFLRWHWDGPSGTRIRHIAFEFYNPYEEPMVKVAFRFSVGGTNIDLPEVMIGPRERVVFAEAMLPGDISELSYGAGVTPQDIGGSLLASDPNLNQTVCVYRMQLGSSGNIHVPIARVNLADFALAVTEDPLNVETDFAAFRRDDEPTHAKYSVATTASGGPQELSYFIGDATPAPEPLGDPNVDNPPGADAYIDDSVVAPTPVYVRNGPFINVGELARIFFVGPRVIDPGAAIPDAVPIDTQLASTDNGCDPSWVDNGRLPFRYDSLLFPPGGGYVNEATLLIPRLRLGMMITEQFTVNSPVRDGQDNDGDSPDGTANIDEFDPDGGEEVIYGRINVNTAPRVVLAALPGLSTLTPADRQTAVDQIIDSRRVGGYDVQYPGFDAAGEAGTLFCYLLGTPATPNNTYPATADGNTALTNYAFEPMGGGDLLDDGLSTAAGIAVEDDLAKQFMPYAWWSNHLTVRSDTYLAFIRVQVGGRRDETRYRRYVALIDRSNCRATGDRPIVRLFARVR